MYLCIFNKGLVALFSFVFVLVIMNVKFSHGQILCTKGPLRGTDGYHASLHADGHLLVRSG